MLGIHFDPPVEETYTYLKPVPGPTTQPKNHLSYMKLRGTVTSARDSSLPPFAAEFVDGGVWVQQEDLPSGETWVKTEASVLLR